MSSAGHRSTSVIAVVSDVGDPSATRTVYITVVTLAALGVLLAGLAIWVLRRTRPEPELLAPLETMDTRSWRKLDPAAQRRLLDEARPPGASPLRREASEPAVDTSFATIAPVASFDDLSEDAAEADDPSDPIEDLDRGDQEAGADDGVDPGIVGRDDEQTVEGPHGDTLDDTRDDALDVTGEAERVAVRDDVVAGGDSEADADVVDPAIAGDDSLDDGAPDDDEPDDDEPDDDEPDDDETVDDRATSGADARLSIDPLLPVEVRSSDETK